MQLGRLMSKKSISFMIRIQFRSRTCCVCRSHLGGGSVVVSSDDRDFVFLTRNVWIPDGARCCPNHMVSRQLTQEGIDSIKPLTIRYQEWSSNEIEVLLGRLRNLYNCRKRFNFDDPRDLSDLDYTILTSLSKDSFDHLAEVVSASSTARNSSYRSIRTAVGVYLCKLRLGLSNSLLSLMFDLPGRRAVSRVMNSARQALVECFTPFNLGFDHISRREIIDNHTTTIARQLMCDGAKDTAILVIDGTYIYIQVRDYRCELFFTFSFSLETAEQLTPEEVVQSSQEAISVETNDDCVDKRLYNCLHRTFPLGFFQQRCFNHEEYSSSKYRRCIKMDRRSRSSIFVL